MKKIAIIISLICLAASGKAQVSVAPEVGFQLSAVDFKSDSVLSSHGSKASYRAGVNVSIKMGGKLGLHVGGFFTVKGYNEDFALGKVKTKLNYIEVPIYLNYTLVRFLGNQVFIGAGPYFGYCLGGKREKDGSFIGPPEYEQVKLSAGNSNSDVLNPLDYGVNANVGLLTTIGLYGRVSYGMGLANVSNNAINNTSIKNRHLGFSIGYQIGF